MVTMEKKILSTTHITAMIKALRTCVRPDGTKVFSVDARMMNVTATVTSKKTGKVTTVLSAEQREDGLWVIEHADNLFN